MRMVQKLQTTTSTFKVWELCKQKKLLAEEEGWDAARAAGQDVDVEMVEDQEDRDLNLLEGRLRRKELKKALLQHINKD